MISSLRARTSGVLGLRLALVTAALVVGCGGAEPAPQKEKEKPVVPVVTGEHPKASPAGFDGVKFTCCADPTLIPAFAAYAELGTKLAQDDLPGASAARVALGAALGAATASPAQAAALQAMGAAPAETPSDLLGHRTALLALFEPMRDIARANGGGSAAFAVAYCPMKPGRWMQAAAPLANPYYGAAMLTCGVFEAL